MKTEQPVRGLGYVERLRMTIAPWKLPLHELFWGRFLNRSNSLVWIDWRGPFSTRLLLHNGHRIELGEVSDNAISFGNARVLSFRERTVLREGNLGAVALAAIKKVLPRKIISVNETKWRSRAQLSNPESSDGWAIHEVVRWPR